MTKTGSTIEVTVERGTWDEEISLDGWKTGSVETHTVDSKRIVLRDKNGKALASGNGVSEIDRAFYWNYDELVAKGIAGRVGDAFVGQEACALINEASAEAEKNASKTDRQIEIETTEAERKAKAEAWANSPEGIAERENWENYEAFKREMERPDSDY
jgi:hypothetical protein